MPLFTLRLMRLLPAVFFFFLGTTPVAAADDFEVWLASLRSEALDQGIRANTLDQALTALQPIPRVLELDQKQPEFTQTFWRYLDARVTETRVRRGRKLLATHSELFRQIGRQYGVQARFLVAFWGLETNFGDNMGGFPVVGSLATLAYDPRRSDFFRIELLAALRILDQGHIPLKEMQGSWAGAMGQPQFMPTTFMHFAVDQDRDGRIDIWHSLPDVFASAANFLAKSGWDKNRTWGREVRLPPDFDLNAIGLETEKLLDGWQKLGIMRSDGRTLPILPVKASILLPAGYRGPAFMVYQNYRTILNWNRSHLYAIAVGHLADRLVGKPDLTALRPLVEIPLSRTQVQQIQQMLSQKGFNAGPDDGVIGSQTRLAIREFQRFAKLPPDGYPTLELLEKLMQEPKK